MITDAYFDRFETPKYQVKNPIQRRLIRGFVSKLHSLFIAAQPVQRVLEVGAGEGFLSGYLSEQFPDIQFSTVELGEADVSRCKSKFPRIDAHQGSIYELERLEQQYDLVMCCEVLEHLEEPERALEQLTARATGKLLLTVPHEPWFRLANLARGKNVSRLGNDSEHINHWGRGSFRTLLESRLEVEQLLQAFPWLLALTHPR